MFMKYAMRRVPRLLSDRIRAPSVDKEWVPPLVPLNASEDLVQIPVLPLPDGAIEAARTWVAKGRITIFGQEIDTGWPVDWRCDPFNSFPRRFAQDINYYGNNINVDIKIPWEIHRLNLLPALAEVLPAGEWAEFVLGWAAEHPVHSTIAWMEGIEQGLRAMAIAQGMARIDVSAINEEQQGRLRGLLATHGKWCVAHRSTKWRQNTNHLLLEEMGALVVGAALSDLPKFRTMGQKAAARLARELERQTCDGRNWEPTTAYHRFVSEALLVTLSASRTLKDATALPLLEALAEKHVDTLQWLCTPGGMMPLVGDDDAGVVLPRSTDWDARQCSEVLDLAQELGFNTKVKEGVRIWPDVGMGVLRSGPWHVHLVSGAPKGKRQQASHRHLDMLSLTVHHHEMPVILDGGTQSYFGSRTQRDKDRSPGQHSGITLEGKELGRIRGPFEILSPALGSLERQGENSLSATIRLSEGITIRREITITEQKFTLTDTSPLPSTSSFLMGEAEVEIIAKDGVKRTHSEMIEVASGYGRIGQVEKHMWAFEKGTHELELNVTQPVSEVEMEVHG